MAYCARAPAGVVGPAGAAGTPGAAGASGAEGVVNYSLIMPEKGLVVTLEDMEIGSDRTPVVTLGITDPNGLPVHPDDLIGLRFMLSYVDVDETTRNSRRPSPELSPARSATVWVKNQA